jgi:hypothetical protein
VKAGIGHLAFDFGEFTRTQGLCASDNEIRNQHAGVFVVPMVLFFLTGGPQHAAQRNTDKKRCPLAV